MHRCSSIYFVGLALALVVSLGSFLETSAAGRIIDTHEHIESLSQAEDLLLANETQGIEKTVLIPSPAETLTLNGRKSFTGYRDNVDAILAIAEKYPKQFIPFCTVSPMASDALEYVKDCIERGGKGIKLYNGHSYYHEIFGMKLNNARMQPIYAFAERNKIPLLFHVNITKFGEEFRHVLDKYPDLVVSVPHFMVSSIGIKKVKDMLEDYPNLYTDISFGSPEFMAAGFRRISKDPGKYADFMNKHYDRVLFGADMVLTGNQKKSQAFIEESLSCYRNLLEKRRFNCSLVSDYYEAVLRDNEQRYESCEPKDGAYCDSLKQTLDVYIKRFEQVQTLSGLGLSPTKLKKIYLENPTRFLRANN